MFELVYYYNHQQRPTSIEIAETCIKQHGHHSLINEYDEFKIDNYLLLDDPDSNIIAIDWDNTVTEAPKFYQKLIQTFFEHAFQPVICTIREPDEEDHQCMLDMLERQNINIYFSDGELKRDYLHSLGISVNLWIDDFFPGIAKEGHKLFTSNNINCEWYG